MVPGNAFKPLSTADDNMIIMTVVIIYSQNQPYVINVHYRPEAVYIFS